MMVEMSHPGVQTQEFLSAFSSSEPLLTALLSSCGSMFLLNNVVPLGGGDHLLVIHVDQARDLPDGRPATAQLIGMNDLWDVIFIQVNGVVDRATQGAFHDAARAARSGKSVDHEFTLGQQARVPTGGKVGEVRSVQRYAEVAQLVALRRLIEGNRRRRHHVQIKHQQSPQKHI